MLNRYVLDANVLVSAVLSPDSTANLAYQKALDTGILLILVQTFAECENVIFCSKFDRYISVVTVVGLRNATQQIKRE
jgi:predicted nucleic acid-binding protein